MSSFQDWKPVTIRKDPVPQTFSGRPGPSMVETEDIPVISTLGGEEGKKIQQARAGKGWTQRDLAMRVGVQTNVIREYETGNVVPDREVLNKLNRILNIKIEFSQRKGKKM